MNRVRSIVAYRLPWVTAPAGTVVMLVAVCVTRSPVLFLLGAVTAVTGLIALILGERAR